MKPIYKIIVLSIVASFLGCGNSENETETSNQTPIDERIKITKVQFAQNNMVLGSVEKKSFPMGIKVNGMIDVPPENKAVVSSTISGYIKTIPLLIGDVVKKGQKLATLESPDFVEMQQEFMEVKEQLTYLKSEYDRQSIMFKEDIISNKVFLKAESQYKTTKAKYNGLKKQLSMLNISSSSMDQGQLNSVVNIYAPISGSITKVNVSRGTYVSPTTSILEIIDNDHVHLELAVFEKDVMGIKKDQTIHFSIPETSDETYNAKVYLVGTSIDDNRTIKVHGHPNEHGQSFLTGMFVKAEIITDSKIEMALPENAIVTSEDGNFILVLNEENDTDLYFKQLKIKSGTTVNGFTEFNDSGIIKESDKVLVNGAFSLIGN